MKVRIVSEISYYTKNEPGVLGRCIEGLSKAKINITGVHIYEGQLESLTRLVVDQNKVDEAEALLREHDISMISQTDILELICVGKPGMLLEIAKQLGDHDINIKILYFTEGPTKETVVYLTVNDVEKALKVVQEELAEF